MKVKVSKRYLGGLALGALLTSTGASAKSNSDIFEDEVAQCNYFSNSPATFATFCFADECHSAASGYTKINGSEAVTPDKLMTIGSNSKFITAILTLIMVDKGYLGLDDTLATYFPEYAHWKGVTLRHLLQHASGVPEYLFSEKGTQRTILSYFDWRTRVWKPSELVALVAKEPSIFEAGTRVEYNNTNYILLGMVLEKVARRPLEVLLDREIFAPLGLQNTYLSLMKSEEFRLVSGYYPLDLPIPDWIVNFLSPKVEKSGNYLDTTRGFDASYLWAAGGMVSTSGDLAKIVRALFTGRLISQELLEEMKNWRNGEVLGFPLRYGLGLMTMPSPYGELLGHGGMTPGYYSVSNYLPQRDVVITMGQNIAPGPTYSVYYDLIDLVNRDFPGKEFVVDEALSPAKLPARSIHIRARGKLLPESPSFGFFSAAFGYSLVKKLPRNEETFRNFQTNIVERDGRSYLTISGSPGTSPYFGQSGKSSEGTPFLKITIDQEKLRARGSGVYRKGEGDGMIFAYRGFSQVDEQGKRSFCVSEVLDRRRASAFQVDGQKDETFEQGETLKFVGNLAMTKAYPGRLPSELPREFRTVCK